MASAAGSIVIDLLAKTGSFVTDMQRASKEVAQFKKEAVAASQALAAAFSGISIAAAYMVKQSIDAMDEMSKMAQKVGTTTEALSALAYAADLAGVNQQELGASMVKLSRTMSDAAMGSQEAAKGFSALGIAVQNSDGTLRDAGDVLADIADKFAGYKDGAEKTALATALFGKAGAQLIPMLNAGRDGLAELRIEAERLGVVLDTETSKTAEEFNDNLTRLQYALKGITNQAASDLLPVMKDVSSMFVELAKNEDLARVAADGVKLAVGGLTVIFQTVAVLGANLAYVFNTIGLEIGALLAKINLLGVSGSNPASVAIGLARSLASGGLEQIRAVNKALDEDTEKALARLTRFEAAVMGLAGAGGNSVRGFLNGAGYGGKGGSDKSAAPRMAGPETAQKQSDFDKYLENLQKQLEKTQDLTVAEQVLTDIRAGRAGDTSPEQERVLLDLATRIDLTKEATSALKEMKSWEDRAADEEQKRLAALVKADEERLKAMLAQGPAAALEKQREEMQFLADAFERGTISAEQYLDAVTGILDLNPAIKEQKSLVEELGLTFTSAFEDAVVSGKQLSDVLKGILQDVLRIIVRRNVTEPLGQAFTSGGGLGDIFSGIGSIFSGIFGGGRAGGGGVTGGTTYLVGEQGPELFTPNTSGRILPNDAMGGGGPAVVNVYNNAPGVRVTPREREQGGVRTLDLTIDQLDQALAQRVSRGNSSLAGAMTNRRSLGFA